MRRSIIILTIAALSAHAVDCVRATFDYFATQYMTEQLNLYILPGSLKPDSLHQQHKSQIYTIKYHWTQNRLDSMSLTRACQEKVHRGTAKVNWKIDSTRVGKLTRYDWIFPDESDNFTVFRGKDSVAIVPDEEQTHTFYIKNDTIHEVNEWLPRDWIIYRDPHNENKCYQGNGQEKHYENGSVSKVGSEIYTTYEFEKRGNTLILKITEPDRRKYLRTPGPCTGGTKYTTIYYRQ